MPQHPAAPLLGATRCKAQALEHLNSSNPDQPTREPPDAPADAARSRVTSSFSVVVCRARCISLSPVFEPQSLDLCKLSRIVGHQNHVERVSMAPDERVERSNRFATPL
jgi:hypothetical protein